MKTMIMNCTKTIDEMIPDANMELVIDKCDKINKSARATVNGIKTTLIAGGATMIFEGLLIKETVELAAIVTKTGVKKAINKASEAYNEASPIVVRR